MNLCVAVPLFFIFQFIHAQPDDLGFISIDCGIPVYSTHQDPVTSILYVSDYGFIGTGENRNISSDYINPSLAKGYFNLRFFPHGPRNCYTLRSLVTGNRYLVRASFYYGNYDGLGKPPIFDLYLGANYWHEVNFDARSVNWMDIIVVSPTDYLQVCLVNKGRGTPFISALELRSLNTTLYPPVNASQSLVLISSNRFLLGPTGKSIIRYPSDHHDRIWSTYDAVPNWTEISTTYVIQNNLSGVYDVPSSVIQNAATVNSSRMDFSWDPSDTSVDISSKYFFVFYLAELQNVPRNAVRQFDIIINNKTWNTQPYTPTYLFANYFSGIVDGMSNFRVSLVSTKNATLPPILNAMEMYLVKPITEVATDSGDAKAMMAIQENFGVIKNWMGDPCNPKAFVWRGLKCSYSAVDPSKITALNLSSFGLVGAISANLRDLKALQYLDLSHNNLSGPIPDFLGELSLLIFLDLSSNDLRGPIPDILLKKSDNGSLSIRYPSDPHDRLWSTYDSIPNWNEVSTTSVVQNYLNDVYDVPSAVMQNAATVNGSRIDFSWGPSVNISSSYFFVFYFSELQNVQSNALRQFDIIINNKTWNMQPYSPPFLFTDSFSGVVQGLASYSVSLVATKNATLPPILNAMEMYLVEPITEVATDPGDARAMMAIQEKFGVKNNWMGDPCAPKAFAWGALNCSYSPVYPSRITALNLSSFGLAGAISTDFGNLNTLQYLDLSHNNLSGTIPDFLGQLPLLIFLDLSSNDLHGVIPYSLLQKSQSGILSLRVGNNANLCADGNACGSGRKKINGALVAAIIIPVIAVISLCILLFLLLRQKIKGKAMTKATGPENESALLENREFSYRELKHITSNFSQEIGKGGFGAVYFGYLENGNPVAVKVHSDSSSQGVKEFLAEAKHLTRIHHKNLVSLIGYCKEKNHLALVYEYMPEGNLQDHLRGSNSKPLTWEQRLHIACDSAQGLEYLHTACTPALIHRDVKSSNILLTAGLGAKVADFGLTKAFGDSKTHITTEPAGTMGYLDPEYFRSYHISEKSDVYSFGVVLLELITGRPPVVPISDSVSIHVGEWVNQSLDHGTIESIVDAKMGGDYDINSVWKVADLALHCKQEVSRERPTMAEVAAQLKECLDLENRRDGRRSLGSLEVDLQGGEIQAVAAGPTLR